MSSREKLLHEIAFLPEPIVEETLAYIRLAMSRHGLPGYLAGGHLLKGEIPDPLSFHPELVGRIHYDPMEPATEEDWPSAAR